MLTISGNWHLLNSNSWCSYQSKHPTIYSCGKKNCKWWYRHTWFLFAWFLLNRCVSFDLHNNLCTFRQISLGGRIRHCVFFGLSSWTESYSYIPFKKSYSYIIGPSYLKLYWLDLPCRTTKGTSKSLIHLSGMHSN
jgi:hypothetical protein